MARESKTARLERIHREALTEFDEIYTATRDVRLQCLDDRRFYSIPGAQWEGPAGEQFANRPRFEFNRVHLAVMRIFSEYRANRITVDFQAKDGQADDMADTCDGLYRADEQASNSDEALDNAFEEAVGGGMGAWRVRTCYEDEGDEEDERQRCVFEPIFDAESTVFFDLDASRADKRNAKRCYVLVPYSRRAYEEEFGDHPDTWPHDIHRREFEWAPADMVWVAERYEVVEEKEKVYFYRPLALGDEALEDKRVTQADIDADPKLLDDLRATGFSLVRSKTVTRKRVWKLLMSGGGILEDCGYIAGTEIPIVVAFGKRWVIDGVERFQGHVRLAKDAQRLENMLYSWLAEMAGRFDVEKPIFTPEQIAGHAQRWARDNVDKFPYLLVNGVEDPTTGVKMPPQQLVYTKVPQIPPAMAALTQIASTALQDMLGNQQAGEQMQPNISGKAVELIQNRLDMQVFIYMSNFAKAVKRCGEIWLSQMRDIAVEEGRRMKTVSTDGTAGSVTLNEPYIDPKTLKQGLRNDMSRATFDVVAGVGPSSQSLRSAVVRALTGIASITEDPQTKQALTLATIANLEGEGLGDLRDWARSQAIRMGIVKPTDDEKRQMAEEQANRQPDPQTMLATQLAEQAAADATKKRAETLETIESARLKQAQTQETLSKIGLGQVAAVIDTAKAMRDAATPPPGLGL